MKQKKSKERRVNVAPLKIEKMTTEEIFHYLLAQRKTFVYSLICKNCLESFYGCRFSQLAWERFTHIAGDLYEEMNGICLDAILKRWDLHLEDCGHLGDYFLSGDEVEDETVEQPLATSIDKPSKKP